MIHTVNPARRSEQLRDLDARILALKVQRQYVTGRSLSLHLDAQIAQLEARLAEVADALVDSSHHAGATTRPGLAGLDHHTSAAA